MFPGVQNNFQNRKQNHLSCFQACGQNISLTKNFSFFLRCLKLIFKIENGIIQTEKLQINSECSNVFKIPAQQRRGHSLTACNTSPPALSKMADGVRELVKTQVIGPSDQLSLNKFFDSIIPSMRTSKIQNGHQGASKWPMGSGNRSNLRLLDPLINFR